MEHIYFQNIFRYLRNQFDSKSIVTGMDGPIAGNTTEITELSWALYKNHYLRGLHFSVDDIFIVLSHSEFCRAPNKVW